MPDVPRSMGMRFSRVYLDAPSRVTDNPRLRVRVSEFFYANFYDAGDLARKTLKSELGVPIPGNYETPAVRDFLQSCDLHDFLDSLTILWQVLDHIAGGRPEPSAAWVAFVNRAMKETGVSFELDERGGVHPVVDAAFVASRQATLSGLEMAKHASAREHFEQAYAALDGASPNTGQAVREMHLSVEAAFRQRFPKASRIDVSEINNLLKPLVVKRLRGPELEAAKLMLTSAGNFITAGHQFRHGSGEPEPSPPSMELTVWMLSQGTAFLRWLIAFSEADEI